MYAMHDKLTACIFVKRGVRAITTLLAILPFFCQNGVIAAAATIVCTNDFACTPQRQELNQ